MEKRLLLAFILSAVIFAVWSAVFPPPRPTPPAVEEVPAAESGTDGAERAVGSHDDAPAPAERGEPVVAEEV